MMQSNPETGCFDPSIVLLWQGVFCLWFWKHSVGHNDNDDEVDDDDDDLVNDNDGDDEDDLSLLQPAAKVAFLLFCSASHSSKPLYHK